MLTLRNAVTKHYSTLAYNYLCRRIVRQPSLLVARDICRIDMHSKRRRHHRDRIYYTCTPNGEPIAWLWLKQRKGWRAWEVAQIWIFPEHRGKGWAHRLYQAAINSDGILLSSGDLHTQYSQALWRSFIRKKLFNIWAQDFKNLKRRAIVEYDADADELECDLEIYCRPSAPGAFRSDVRLLALKKEAA